MCALEITVCLPIDNPKGGKKSDQIIPWGEKKALQRESWRKKSVLIKWKTMWKTGPVQILVDIRVNILTDCIWLWLLDSFTGVTGLD